MKILQLCKKFPYPPNDGETIAILNLTRAFHELGHEMTVLAINTLKHYFDINKLPAHVKQWADFHSVEVNTNVNPLRAVQNLFSKQSYHIERFIDESYDEKLKELLKRTRFDIIQLEGLYLTPYLETVRKYSNAPVVMRSHNVEFEIWDRMLESTRGLRKRYLSILSSRLRHFEVTHLNDYDALVPISPRDEKVFRGLGAELPMKTIPAGIRLPEYKSDHSKLEYPSVFMLGGLDWIPNQDGVRWFVEDVWPELNDLFPGLKFYVAGRNAPSWMDRSMGPNIFYEGEVEDAKEFYRSKSILIVPLLAGSGMRIKILEGMALEKAIVTTSVGMEGIEAKDGEHLLVANDAKDFANSVTSLVRDKDLFTRLGQNGRRLIEEHYDQEKLASSLIDFYKNTLS